MEPVTGFETPVVLIIFNRPGHTMAALEAIAAVRPRTLLVIADGPRPARPDDIENCRASRALLDRVDWDCDLRTDFAETNLGCGRRISTGLNWVFAQVDRAVILEDDCVADATFFPFCAELLARHCDDQRVRTIAGSSFLAGRTRNEWSYRFSQLHDIWGWATWRRSWQRVDMTMSQWPAVRDGGWLLDILGDARLARFWGSRFNRAYDGDIDTWAYPYLFSCWLDHSLAITTNRNLITNHGAGESATHTSVQASYMGQPAQAMPFPLAHPPFTVCDLVSDRETFRRRYLPERSPWPYRAARRVYYLLAGRRHVFSVKLGRGALRARPMTTSAS